MGLDHDVVMQYFDIKIAQSWENDQAHVATAITMLDHLKRLGNECAGKLMTLSVRVARIGIDSRDFNAYSFARFGRGYTSKIDVLLRIESEIEELAKLPREVAIAHVKQIASTGQAT